MCYIVLSSFEVRYYYSSGRLIVGDSVPGVEFLPFVKAKMC